jgi:hypothetical protein
MPQRPAKLRVHKRTRSTRTVTDIEEPNLERPEYVPDGGIKDGSKTDNADDTDDQ